MGGAYRDGGLLVEGLVQQVSARPPGEPRIIGLLVPVVLQEPPTAVPPLGSVDHDLWRRRRRRKR